MQGLVGIDSKFCSTLLCFVECQVRSARYEMTTRLHLLLHKAACICFEEHLHVWHAFNVVLKYVHMVAALA